MRISLFLPLLLAACSAADAPEGSPETNLSVAPGSEPAPVATASSAVAESPAPAAPASTPSPTGQPETPATGAVPEDGPEQSAGAAAQVVRRYFRLIGRGAAAEAQALWDDGGRAAGSGAAAFARSLDRFARYDATVGQPGRIDAGAGQRYVEVPVAVTGTLRTGKPATMRGTAVLHRAGAIDGATPAQRRWRIARIELAPQAEASASPTAAATTEAPAVARYRCKDGSLMLVRFGAADESADVELGGELLGKLDGKRTGSDLAYKRGETELRGKGDQATIVRPGAAELTCAADRQP